MAEEYVGRKFKTEFLGSKPHDESAFEEIIDAGRRLYELGLAPENAGNLSVRVGHGMLITVGGVSKGAMSREDISEVVDFDFQIAKVLGVKEPSSETPMHWLVYQCYPMAKAVIHAHDPLALASGDKLKLTIGVHSTKTQTSYGTEDQAHQTIEALSHCQYAIIRGHGIICMGQTIRECMDLIERIHRLLDGKGAKG